MPSSSRTATAFSRTGKSERLPPTTPTIGRLRAGLVAEALEIPDVHLHVYDKQHVFERRKMGHVTALDADADAALDRARRGRAKLRWQGEAP